MSPANWTNAVSSVFALRIAQSRIIVFIGGTLHRIPSRSAVRVFVARNTDVSHAVLTVWRTDTTAYVVIAIATDGIPQETILLAVITLLGGSCTTTIGWGLGAISTVVSEVRRAILPANGTNAIVPFSAERIAEPSILLFI